MKVNRNNKKESRPEQAAQSLEIHTKRAVRAFVLAQRILCQLKRWADNNPWDAANSLERAAAYFGSLSSQSGAPQVQSVDGAGGPDHITNAEPPEAEPLEIRYYNLIVMSADVLYDRSICGDPACLARLRQSAIDLIDRANSPATEAEQVEALRIPNHAFSVREPF
jgi:hypothetical protein